MEYTIRDIPEHVDQALRRRAEAEGKPLNQVVVEALSRGANATIGNGQRRRDLSDIAGSISEADADAIEQAVRWMDEGDLTERNRK